MSRRSWLTSAPSIAPCFSRKRAHRHDGLGHRAVAAGAAERREVLPDELAGVARVAEVPHRQHQHLVDDARDERPLDVLELQEEVGDVGDQVLARRLPHEGAEDLVVAPPGAERLHDVLEALERDFRAFHLADHRRVGQRVEERERLEVHAVGLAVEEQRVGLDRVEQRGRRALRDVHVHGAQVLGEDRGRRAVVGPDVLEHRAVAGLRRVVVDDEVHACAAVRRSSAAARPPSRSARTRPARPGVIDSTWMSSRFAIRRFSGRVTPCSVPRIAVAFVRRRMLRSARPLAIASGSGSLCSRIRTRSASAKYRWYCWTRARVSDRLIWRDERAAEAVRPASGTRRSGRRRAARPRAACPACDAHAEHVDERGRRRRGSRPAASSARAGRCPRR